MTDGRSDQTDSRGRRVVIIGAGPGGMCAAIKLREAGVDDIVVLERSGQVGGTWNHNRYPGCACDVRSHLYSFSFEPKVDWSRPYATQPEILDYFRQLAERYELLSLIRFDTCVDRARWDDDGGFWLLTTSTGEEIEADVVISALGMFNEARYPDIAGLDDFGGTMFHSGRWDDQHDLTGRSVAVIGTAASAVQFIPEIAPRVGQLHVFQRSPQWVLPKEDTPYTDEELDAFRNDPTIVAASRAEIAATVEAVITFSNPELLELSTAAGRRNLEAVDDPAVRAALTPSTPWGCHRPLSSQVYYPTFNRPNVELVTESISKITADAVVTADGVERPVDTIICATGFATTKYLSTIDVVGRGGRSLHDDWADGAHAYLGVTVSGFPNLFMLYGPNTNNGSILFMIERQVDYVVRQLRWIRDESLTCIDVRPEVMEAYNDDLQRDLAGVDVWQAGCSTYYRGPSGRIVTQWPHTMDEYRRRTEQPDTEAYEVVWT